MTFRYLKQALRTVIPWIWKTSETSVMIAPAYFKEVPRTQSR